ncbi:MAG: molybdopterin biosynthesis protein [Desulfohalobiaceae bacterium]
MSNSRNIYLSILPIEQAMQKTRQALQQVLPQPPREKISTSQAAGRITAKPVYAKYSSPTFHSAAMDGIALRARDTFQAREGAPVILELNADFVWVNTGEPLPLNMDAVVMIEELEQLDQKKVALEKPAFPWQHVRRIGEDIVATELILPQNHLLSPYDIGALLSAGIWELEVLARPHIHFIPTGDEVLDFQDQPEPGAGQVVESNSQVLGSLASAWGCSVSKQKPVPDDRQALELALQEALSSQADIVVIGAGSSAGSRDFTRQVMQSQGQILVHGIAAMPGKPSLLGLAGKKLLVGAPGYPVSAVVCFEQLVRPLLQQVWGLKIPERPRVDVHLTRKMPSKLGQEEFLRLSIGQVHDKLVGTPLARGAGLITSLCRAQGVARIPADCEGISAGETLRTELLVPFQELQSVLVCVGSHDNILDLLANELMGLAEPIRLASTHVGSMAGMTSLQNKSAHMAGMHLFDPETQDFNFPFLQKYLPDRQLQVVNLAIRKQGFILPKGNPKGIQGLQDLLKDEVRFINRQRGSGTRILLDHHLKQQGINPRQIQGYQQEEYTHMAVAVNVLTGSADCGLGIKAAAQALDLDFVPLARERYDLVLPEKSLQEQKVQTVLELLQSPGFQEKIQDLGGYETGLTGRIMQPGQGLAENHYSGS